MKKVVLLAPYFLPRRRVGVWRPFKFAIHLKKYGWDPSIITIKEQKGSLTEKEKELLSDIPIYKIKPPFDFTYRLNNGMAYSGFAANGNSSEGTNSLKVAKNVINWVDKQLPVDSWLPLFMLKRKYIENIIDHVEPDLLWSTGDPWSSHWLGAKLADKFHLPWVADFRDPWTLGDINLKNRSQFSFRVDEKEEDKVLRKASALTFNAKETEDLYIKKYKELDKKSSTIYNCYDSTLFNSEQAECTLFDEKKLNLIFFGKFRPLSPAAPFINLLEKLHKANPEAAKAINMYSFGKLSESETTLAKKKGVYDNLVFLDHIPLEDGLNILSRADILWLSTHPSRKNIIPAKLWDYLAVKRPILSIAPNPEIENILKKAGAGIQLNINQPASITELLLKAVEAKQASGEMPISVSFDDEAIKQYDAALATKKLVAIFDRLV